MQQYLFCQWGPESHPVLKIRMCCISITTFPVFFSVLLLVTLHNLFALSVASEHQDFLQRKSKITSRCPFHVAKDDHFVRVCRTISLRIGLYSVQQLKETK